MSHWPYSRVIETPRGSQSSGSYRKPGTPDATISTSKWPQFMLGLLAFSFLVLGSPLAQTSFLDTFEDDLSRWVGKSEGAHSGIIVEDPLRPGNHVLTFTGLTGAGDVFGSDVTVSHGQTHVLTFEYLGLPNGGVPGDLGGAIGFAEDTPGRNRWLAATVLCCGVEDDPLIDDGQWHTYYIEFDIFANDVPFQNADFSTVPPSNDTVRLMLEDFFLSEGVAGDVFFDNVRFSRPPVELLLDLIPEVVALDLHNGIANSLDAKLGAALKKLTDKVDSNNGAAIGTLGAFINSAQAQSGKKIPEGDAARLIADARAIIDLLNVCRAAEETKLKAADAATTKLFGTGFPGSAGTPLLAAAPGSLPSINDTFTVQITSLPTSALHQTFVVLGLSKTNWAGFTLPQDLAFIGAPGRTQYVSFDASVLLPPDTGVNTWDIPIPNNQRLKGLKFFLQGVVADFAGGAIQISVTNALEGVIR